MDEKKETDDNATKSEYVPPPREVDLDAPSRILLHMPVDIRSMALAIIAALAVLAVLRWAQGFFIPLMLGFVFYYALSPAAQAVFLSGVGMPTVDVLDAAERELGKPAISSAAAMMWNALCVAGVTTPVQGYGRLLSSAR